MLSNQPLPAQWRIERYLLDETCTVILFLTNNGTFVTKKEAVEVVK
jgi:hypothetical protein